MKVVQCFLMGLFVVSSIFPIVVNADNGYRLWLKYDKIDNSEYLSEVREMITSFNITGNSPTTTIAKKELKKGLEGLLDRSIQIKNLQKPTANFILGGTPSTLKVLKRGEFKNELSKLGSDGYFIRKVKVSSGYCILIGANEDIGVLYGAFHLLRLLQIQTSLDSLDIISSPKVQLRMLNHWDDLNGTVERGYAGKSLWKWDELPEKIDPRYIDYARANASIGINGVALNSVNARPKILTTEYLHKVAALANVFRPFGIKVFLSVNFASPRSLGKLETADPLDPNVIQWWKEKADEIYELIPDFGGFLVKADSEGQPGPGTYHRTHAQGANMLADALKPHKGILIWRAFVYGVEKEEDRIKMAYSEFIKFDNEFHSNAFLQVKNGPLDFQPREPFSPLFGAMPNTNEMIEFQITQEYLGHSRALVYLAPLFKETLEADTYARGKGSTVGRVLDGSLQGQQMTGMAGVANTGDDGNWTGYIFGQANWYAFGRLVWDHDLSAEEIADEWIKMTLTHDSYAIRTISDIMLGSRETFVDYEMPLGLSILSGIGGYNSHYSPDPGLRGYYHRADSIGLGFDRTSDGSDAVAQYFPPVRDLFNDIHTCPEEYLVWFHHVPWDYRMKSGRTFWEELYYRYYRGVRNMEETQRVWGLLKEKIDPEIFTSTSKLLSVQVEAAKDWREVCLTYFQKFSRQEIPGSYKLSNDK